MNLNLRQKTVKLILLIPVEPQVGTYYVAKTYLYTHAVAIPICLQITVTLRKSLLFNLIFFHF